VQDLIVLLDPDRRIARLNKPLADALGLTFDEAIGAPLEEVLNAREYAPDSEKLAEFFVEGEERQDEVSCPGSGRIYDVRVFPFKESGGREIAFICAARDITDRKKWESELRKAHDELEMRVKERTAELAAANLALEEKIATIDELYEHLVETGKAKVIAQHTAEVAHELRQPLAVIGGLARRSATRLGRSTEDDLDQHQENLTLIVKEVGRLEKILGGLIDFNRIGGVTLKPSDPNEIIELVAKMNEPLLAERGIRIELQLGREVGEIPLDPDRFQQVVRNLLTNAIEASPANNVISIDTGLSEPTLKARETIGLDSDAYFEMKIRNQGDPIDPHLVDQIFNPFVTTKKRGTGLGLTLSQKIVKDHRGSISIKSEAGATVSTVWLPSGEGGG
jgi:PAS domain S-box-containing protein